LKFYEISSLIIPKVVYNNIYALRNIDRIWMNTVLIRRIQFKNL
jgi:hypothetical protein